MNSNDLNGIGDFILGLADDVLRNEALGYSKNVVEGPLRLQAEIVEAV